MFSFLGPSLTQKSIDEEGFGMFPVVPSSYSGPPQLQITCFVLYSKDETLESAGSLVVRSVLQPFEESAFTMFSKAAPVTADEGLYFHANFNEGSYIC